MRLISGLARRLWLGLQCFRAICVTPAADGVGTVTVNDASGAVLAQLGSTAGSNGMIRLHDGAAGASPACLRYGAADQLYLRNVGETDYADLRLRTLFPPSDNGGVIGSSTLGWGKMYIGTDTQFYESSGILLLRNSADTSYVAIYVDAVGQLRYRVYLANDNTSHDRRTFTNGTGAATVAGKAYRPSLVSAYALDQVGGAAFNPESHLIAINAVADASTTPCVAAVPGQICSVYFNEAVAIGEYAVSAAGGGGEFTGDAAPTTARTLGVIQTATVGAGVADVLIAPQ